MEYNFSSLKGKNILITGANGAIGHAIAEGFSKADANVILWGHKSNDSVNGLQNFYSVELTDKEDIQIKFDMCLKKYSLVHSLVNCAGFTCGETSELYQYDMWTKTLAINLTAPFLISQLFANQIISNKIKGSIINITSIGAELGFPENPAYVASKGGLKQLSKALAYDWAKYGIRVNNIGPGYTKTNMTKSSWNNEEKRSERSSRTLLNCWAEPEDIVGSVMFLASDMAQYITGQDLYVDAGWTVKGL